MSWNDAKTRCEYLNGYLATITSQAEDVFIYQNLVQGYYDSWLGGTDEATEGNWHWITGETWGYSNWRSSMPDDGCGGEDYLTMHQATGQWNDQRNDGTCGNQGLSCPICEFDEGPNKPPVITSFSATPKAGNPPLTVTFNCSASDPDGSTSQYRWDFGDGENDTTTIRTTAHTYPDLGTFNAKVTIVDDDGCRSFETTAPTALPPQAAAS